MSRKARCLFCGRTPRSRKLQEAGYGYSWPYFYCGICDQTSDLSAPAETYWGKRGEKPETTHAKPSYPAPRRSRIRYTVPGELGNMTAIEWINLAKLMKKFGVTDEDWESEVDLTLDYYENKAHLSEIYGTGGLGFKSDVDAEMEDMKARAQRGMDRLMSDVRDRLERGFSVTFDEARSEITIGR